MRSSTVHREIPASSPVSVETMVAAIEDDVIFGRLHPRERLVEDELIERFGATRHAVRDVLATLDRLGLVERRKNVGAFVRSFSPREVEEVYHLRGLLETEAARLIELPASSATIDKLVAIQRRHDAAVKTADLPQLFRLNIAFHETLFSTTGNLTLQQAITEFARRTHSIRFLSMKTSEYRGRAAREHWEIIDALKSGNRKALVRLCEIHLHPARDAFLADARLALPAH